MRAYKNKKNSTLVDIVRQLCYYKKKNCKQVNTKVFFQYIEANLKPAAAGMLLNPAPLYHKPLKHPQTLWRHFLNPCCCCFFL